MIRGLWPHSEFIPDACHGNDEAWCLGVRLYLASQPGDKHVDASIVGSCATSDNGTAQLVTRQHLTGTACKYGQQRELGAGQWHFSAVAINKDVGSQVELAVLDR